MPGIRLHPNYHRYELKDPLFEEVLHLAATNKLVVQLVAAMGDLRTQHPLLCTPPADLSPLAQVIKSLRCGCSYSTGGRLSEGGGCGRWRTPARSISTLPCRKGSRELPGYRRTFARARSVRLVLSVLFSGRGAEQDAGIRSAGGQEGHAV